MLKGLALAWLLGIACMGQQLHFLATFGVGLASVFMVILLLQLYMHGQIQSPMLRCCNIAAGCILALGLGYSYAQWALGERLNLRETQIQTVDVIVYVHRINQPSARSISQQVLVLNAHDQAVNWLTFTRIDEKTAQPQTPILQLGSYYRLQGEIRPAHSYATQGAFDQEKWYLQQNIMAGLRIQQAQVLSAREIQQLVWQPHQGVWAQLTLAIEKQRLAVREFMLQQPIQHKGLLLGLLTGDRSLLAERTEDDFRRLGLSHLLAISGPHVLIFAAMVCFALHQLIVRYRPSIYLKLAKNYLLIVPFLICVAVYCACVGFEIPALRTLLIASLSCVFLLFRQALKPFSLLVYSAALLLLFDPFSVLSAAFWLSYVACFILLRIYQTIQSNESATLTVWQRTQQGCKVLLESQWKIFVALLPLMLIFFKQIAWLSPLTNLIAIPYLGLVVVPLDIMAGVAWLLFEPLGVLLWYINDALLGILLGILKLFDTWWSPQLMPWAMNEWQLMALILALIILFLPRGLLPKIWAVVCLLPVFYYNQDRYAFELNVLDVGQGQAIFIRDQAQSLMVDVGGSPNEAQFSIGENVIFPFLMRRGVQRLDQVVLTHLDQDHSGAYAPLSAKIKIKQLMSNEQPMPQLANFDYCQRGKIWQWQRVKFEVLAPPESALAQASQARNETSCVLYISYQGQQQTTHFLLMGDAGWLTEHQILMHYPDLKVDVLVLGHHGSKHSSAYGFLQHYQPQIAIASAGFANRYHHPTNEVKARLNALNITWLSTIEHGSLQFSFDQQEQLLLQSERQQRLWLQREAFQFAAKPQPLAHYINRPKQDLP